MEKYDISEGNDALKRVLLMMKYDDKKTLTENVKEIDEQPSPGVVAATTGGALTGAAFAGGVGAATTAGSTAITAGAGLGATLAAGGGALLTAPILLPAAAVALTTYGLYKLVDWMANKDLGKTGFEQVMSACKSPGVSKLVPKMSKSEIRTIAYSIEDAKGQWNDDEDDIVSALQKIESIADLCAVDKKVTGGLVQFLDDLTDSPDEWKMFTRPLAGMIEDTEIVLTPEDQKKVKSGGGKSKGKCPAVTNTGISYDYQYPGDTKYIYGIKNKQWYAKNISNGKEFNINICFPGMAAKLNKGVTKITPTPTTSITKPEDLGISNTSDLGNEDLIDNNKPFK